MSSPPPGALLERLLAEGVIDTDVREALASHAPTPWWLAALLAIAAWIAALIILSTFFIPLAMVSDGAVSRAIGGVLLLAAALWLFRRESAFAVQMALAFSLAGQGLLAFATAGDDARMWNTDVTAAASLAIGAAMLWPPTSPAHRVLCGMIVLGNAAWLIGPGWPLALFGILLAAVAAALWLARADWAAHPQAPIVKAVAHATTFFALCLAPYGHAEWLGAVFDGVDRDAAVPLGYAVGAGTVLVAVTAWLMRHHPSAQRIAAVVAALAFALATHPAPGLVVAAALLLATFHACHRTWTLLSLAFAALYLGELYYSLHTTLLVKSLALAASGALLLLLRAALRSWAGRTT